MPEQTVAARSASVLSSLESHSNEMLRLLQAKRVPHALLLTGPEGSGKAEFQRIVSQALLCTNQQVAASSLGGIACGECNACRIFIANNHPDFIYRDAQDRDSRRVGEARQILHILGLRPFIGVARVVLVDHAEELQTQASNALLKSIEEPFSGTYFLLSSSNRALMLPTISSRCREMYFPAPHGEEILSALAIDARDPEKTLMAHCAEGSLVRARRFLEESEVCYEFANSLNSVADGDLACILEVADRFGKLAERQAIVLEFCIAFAAHQAREAGKQDGQARWSRFALDLIQIERWMDERNFNAGYLLRFSLSSLAGIGDRWSLIGDTFSEYV